MENDYDREWEARMYSEELAASSEPYDPELDFTPNPELQPEPRPEPQPEPKPAPKPEPNPTPKKKGKGGLIALAAAAVAVVALLVLRPWSGSGEAEPGPGMDPAQSHVQQTAPEETTVPPETTQPEQIVYVNPFEDVTQDAVYYEPVLWAVYNGIINGTSETTFSPDEPCMRGQMVTMLWRAAGCPAPQSTVSPFEDVPQDSVYLQAVLWAYENGIAGGTDATHFGTDQVCSRAQVITFLHRAVGSPQAAITEIPCTDVEPGAYYYDAVLWAYEKGISSGVSATEFGVNVICTRSQIATLLYRAYNNG